MASVGGNLTDHLNFHLLTQIYSPDNSVCKKRDKLLSAGLANRVIRANSLSWVLSEEKYPPIPFPSPPARLSLAYLFVNNIISKILKEINNIIHQIADSFLISYI